MYEVKSNESEIRVNYTEKSRETKTEKRDTFSYYYTECNSSNFSNYNAYLLSVKYEYVCKCYVRLRK